MPQSEHQTKQVMIVAGESSGDLHGSHLLNAAAAYPQLSFFGVGGKRMAEAGCRLLFNADELSVMGVWEVCGRLPTIIRRFRQLKKLLHSKERPDLLILIDFPDFNLRLAKVAWQVGVPILYYISPKVWAWRSGRARLVAERVDRLALIFPFEKEIYRPFGVAAEYVGNPLLDEFAARADTEDLRGQLGIGAGEQVVGIFPGSRQSELHYIFSRLIETAQQIQRDKPQVKFLLPVAPSLQRSEIEQRLQNYQLPIRCIEGDVYQIAEACDAVLSVSGTVTLQLALTGTPMAVLYQVAPLSYAIGKRLIKVEHASLTNIVAGRGIVREFIQNDADPAAMSAEILRLLDDLAYRQQMQADLAEVRRRLGGPGCSRRVAALVAEMLDLQDSTT